MADPLFDLLVQVGLRPSRSSEFLRMYCPFHPNPSGRTLWVSHETGGWGCFSVRCSEHKGGDLARLLNLRGLDRRVAESAVKGLDLSQRERHQRPESLEDVDWSGLITDAHVRAWGVDWFLASEVCAAVMRAGGADLGRPLSTWAPECPARPGQVEHDFWTHLWYPLVHRGLQPHALDLMETGLDRERGLLVFPVRGPAGDLRGVARRECRDGAGYNLDGCVWKAGEPGFVYHPVKRGDTLYGWSHFAARIGRGEPVVVVEGYADQLRLAGLGYCAVAKLGKQMSRDQVALLSSAPGPKVLWPDFDRDGLAGCRVEASRLAAVPGVGVVTTGGGVKDAGDARVDSRLAARVIASAVHPAVWLSNASNLLAQIAA